MEPTQGVDARAAGRMVLVRSHAERIMVLFNDEVVADHPREFRRDQIIYDPWHYLPVLMKKPGALRNGAPFKDWDLPPALIQVRVKLKQHADGDRQFVKVLGTVLTFPYLGERIGIPAKVGYKPLDYGAELNMRGVPVVALAGTCMEAGKTAAASAIIARMRHRGLVVAGIAEHQTGLPPSF